MISNKAVVSFETVKRESKTFQTLLLGIGGPTDITASQKNFYIASFIILQGNGYVI